MKTILLSDLCLFSGNTALHWACLCGHMELVQALLDSRATADCLNNEQLAPIHLAVYENHHNILKILLERKTLINCVSPETGFYPLHIAAEKRNMESAEILIQYGASVTMLTDEIPDSPEMTTSVFHLAAKELTWKYYEVDLYPERKKYPTRRHIALDLGFGQSEVRRPLENVRREERRTFPILDMFMKHLPSEQVCSINDSKYGSILHLFAAINYAAGIEKLTGAPYNLPLDELNGAGYSPLLIALNHHSLEAVEELVKHSPDVTRYDPKRKETATELLMELHTDKGINL